VKKRGVGNTNTFRRRIWDSGFIKQKESGMADEGGGQRGDFTNISEPGNVFKAKDARVV